MSLRKHIPLFQVLKELKDYQRQIIVDHLDDSTCKSLANCIASVLRKSRRISHHQKQQIKRAVRIHQKFLKKIISAEGSPKNSGSKRLKTSLTRIGGEPLGLLLSTAIPLLVEFLF